jgi:hypothetical protein
MPGLARRRCGQVNERRKPGGIIFDDFKRAAQNPGVDFEKAADNIDVA